MASNAWERAQEAIAHASQRATERDEDVITPDTAASPFDASATTVLPHGLAARAAAIDPDLTQRLPHQSGGRRTNGHHRAEEPQGQQHQQQQPPQQGDGGPDRRTTRFGPAHPGTSPFPASPFPTSDGVPRAETPAPAKPRRPWWRRLFGG